MQIANDRPALRTAVRRALRCIHPCCILSYILAVLAITVTANLANAQTMQSPDITKVPTLFVVPYAHLDTQWRWDFQQSISEYLLKTMRVNFDYMDK